jgi:hypothetical protein
MLAHAPQRHDLVLQGEGSRAGAPKLSHELQRGDVVFTCVSDARPGTTACAALRSTA